MTLRKVVLDTNLYIGFLNTGRNAPLFTGPGLVRYLPGVVLMELRAGAKTTSSRKAVNALFEAYRTTGRFVVPSADTFDTAGRILFRLRATGLEVRRTSLVNDVLIALSARSIGASVLTADADYETIATVIDFKLEMIAT